MADTSFNSSKTVDLLFTQSNSTTRDPISQDFLNIFHFVMTGVWYTICFTGITTNAINIRTFYAMGLEDSVTVSLFTLALSDCCLCSVAVVELSSFFVDVIGRRYNLVFYYPPLITTLHTMCVRRIFTTSTVMITTFLAFQRCLCVALPFLVKIIFTRFRTVCFFVIVFILDATVHLLFLSQHPTYVKLDPIINVSQVALIVPSSSEPVPLIIEVVIGIGLNTGCQIIVIICLMVMAYGLQRSLNFKKASAAFSGKENFHLQEVAKSYDKSNAKEYQAMVQVSLVSTIFVACNLPLLIFGITNLIIPGIDMYGEYHNLYHFIQNIMYTAELLNSSVNLIVYYNFNTKFRKFCFITKQKKTGR